MVFTCSNDKCFKALCIFREHVFLSESSACCRLVLEPIYILPFQMFMMHKIRCLRKKLIVFNCNQSGCFNHESFYFRQKPSLRKSQNQPRLKFEVCCWQFYRCLFYNADLWWKCVFVTSGLILHGSYLKEKKLKTIKMPEFSWQLICIKTLKGSWDHEQYSTPLGGFLDMWLGNRASDQTLQKGGITGIKNPLQPSKCFQRLCHCVMKAVIYAMWFLSEIKR